MSRAVSKQYTHLRQFKHAWCQWGKLTKQLHFTASQSQLENFSLIFHQKGTLRPTIDQILLNEFEGLSCKKFLLGEKLNFFSSIVNTSSTPTSSSIQFRGCLENHELKQEAKYNLNFSGFTSITRFYHCGQSREEKYTSPNVRLYEVRKLTTGKENHVNASHNEPIDPSKRSITPATEENDIANTDFEVQQTLAQKFVKSCPSAIQPYLQLMRIDRPIGTWLLFWPCGWGIALAAGAGNWPDPWLLAVFGSGALVMRGAGCTINDLWDRDIDSKVARTKDRPVASGAVQSLDAVVFLGAQLGAGLLVLLQLNWPSILLGAASLGLVCTYPLVKRVWHWPQLVLGLTFNWGVLLGWCAVHGNLPILPLLPLYSAGVFWTLIYDTIYAHQDKSDDLSIGIKSTALMFGDSTRTWLGGFGVCMVGNLLLTGCAAGLAWPYYVATAATAANIVHQLRHLDIHNRAQCGQQFRHNRHIGLLVFLGLVGGSLLAQSPDLSEHSQPPLWASTDPRANQLLLQE